MSTNDVPGLNPLNRDNLHAGCWGEHADGTLLYVLATENREVVFELYDMSDPAAPIEFRDTMPLKAFEKKFSYDPKLNNDIWVWHDKTMFPWERVLKKFKSGVKPVSAQSQIDEADKVAAVRKKRTGKGRTPTQKKRAKVAMLNKLAAPVPEQLKEAVKPKRKKLSDITQELYTGVVPTEVEDAINAIDELPGKETIARRIASERALMPHRVEHADMQHRVEREEPKGLGMRIRDRIQAAINKLRPGRGE